MRWHWLLLAVGLAILGPARSAPVLEHGAATQTSTVVYAGAIFSSTQSGSQSFLRFYNVGATAGAATVTLRDYASGQTLGTWTSPSIPGGAEQQFPITTVESGAGNFTKPSYYAIDVQATFNGYFQHVLWRSSDGTLTNLSTCASGVTADTARLSGVHSSLLSTGYPSTIAVNNTGTVSATVVLTIYDARDGTRLATYTTAAIPAGGQLVLPVTTIETGARITPTGSMYHYVIRASSSSTTFLQNLVTNAQAGVVTDMTTACALVAPVSAVPAAVTRAGTVFSSAQAASQSFLRFFNTTATAGTVTVTLQDYVSGQTLGTWTSPSIAGSSEQQFSISTVESGTGATFAKPSYYTVKVQSSFDGYFQHVLWRSSDGTLTNLSTCDAGIKSDTATLGGVHSSLLASGYPGSIVVNNTGSAATTVTLDIYDARDGTKLGTYTTAAIPARGNAIVAISALEAGARITPTAGMYHYVIKANGVFTGFLQNLVNNTKAAVTTDMTTACAMQARQSGTTLTYVAGSTAKIDQFMGDCDYQVKAATGNCQRTLTQSETRYGLVGTDLGNSFEANGKAIFLFGDTTTTVSSQSQVRDSIAYTTATDPDAGVQLSFYTKTDGTPLFVQMTGINMGAGNVPDAGISLSDGIYLVCTTGADATLPNANVNKYALLVRFDETAKTFTVVRNFAPVGSKFLQVALRASGGYVYIIGAGDYRASDLYLARTPEATFASGTGTQYFAGLVNGQPTWSTSESSAVPIIQDNPYNGASWPNGSPTIGNVSVAYSSQLGLWFAVYDGGRNNKDSRGTYLSYASQPWGPWAPPQLVFNDTRDNATGQYIHDPSITPNPPGDGLNGPTIGPNDVYTTAGGAYAPRVIERFLRVTGNTLRVYFTESTWNPYTVVLLRADLTIGTAP